MQALLQLADELRLTVIERRVAHTSGYRAGADVIYLTPRLPRLTARSVLAHEIGHHVLCHQPTEFGPIRARQEREANEWAARLLIDVDRYREVEHIRDGHIASMAHDLDVAPELVAAFRRSIARIGDTVYVAPRMGAGQYTYRRNIA